MLQTKYFLKIILTALLILLPVQAWAATVNKCVTAVALHG